MDFALPQAKITAETPIHLGPAIFRMLTSPRLLDAVERFIGPEIVCNPIHHTRIKLPQREIPEDRWNSHTAATDWHQDHGVALPEQDELGRAHRLAAGDRGHGRERLPRS